jgi:diadenosine tetraphosphate (Ap4A) HIT family hydrolase
VFHRPPSPHETNLSYYDDNPTPFGAILRGEGPAQVLAETDMLLAFVDRHPRAMFHVLIIPKQYIESVHDLTPKSVHLLYQMKEMADKLVGTNSARFVFHVPPFNSVSHLHLHVLAPVNSMSWIGKLKYWSETCWCVSYDSVISRLQKGESATPNTSGGSWK